MLGHHFEMTKCDVKAFGTKYKIFHTGSWSHCVEVCSRWNSLPHRVKSANTAITEYITSSPQDIRPFCPSVFIRLFRTCNSKQISHCRVVCSDSKLKLTLERFA